MPSHVVPQMSTQAAYAANVGNRCRRGSLTLLGRANALERFASGGVWAFRRSAISSSMNDQKKLAGLRVAMVVAEGFEQVEMTEPRKALEAAGARVSLVSPESGTVLGFNHHDKGDAFAIDVALGAAKAEDFDALVLPGGVANPDALRMLPEAVAFIGALAKAGKPIAAICHAPWTLIEAGVVAGKTLTSWPSLQTDLRNAGAMWVDKSVVVDGKLVTSRKPDDLADFNRETIALFAASGALQAPAR